MSSINCWLYDYLNADTVLFCLPWHYASLLGLHNHSSANSTLRPCPSAAGHSPNVNPLDSAHVLRLDMIYCRSQRPRPMEKILERECMTVGLVPLRWVWEDILCFQAQEKTTTDSLVAADLATQGTS